MAEEGEDDSLMDVLISSWEQQCVHQLEQEPDLEGQLANHRNTVNEKIWSSFQNTATAIALLYKDRLQDVASLWAPFQTAAGGLTALYKDCGDGIRKVSEAGIQCGYQRRNKELMQWARKRRRNIRREDLIAYLAGKPPPPRSQLHHRSSPRPRLMYTPYGHQPSTHAISMPHHHSVADAKVAMASVVEENMKIFGEAITLNARDSRWPRNVDFNSLFASELARNCIKRPASSSPESRDVNMDSPTHKRSKHL